MSSVCVIMCVLVSTTQKLIYKTFTKFIHLDQIKVPYAPQAAAMVIVNVPFSAYSALFHFYTQIVNTLWRRAYN